MSAPLEAPKCRTCLQYSSRYHKLDEYVEKDYKIVDMLDGIVPQIHIRFPSLFSHLVCGTCVDKLLNGYKFQQLCIETDKRQHGMLLGDGDTRPAEVVAQLNESLTVVESFKIKQELDVNVNYKCEINPEEFSINIKSEDAWQSDDGEYGGVGASDRDTDSSNEKLNILRERKLRKSITQPKREKSNKDLLAVKTEIIDFQRLPDVKEEIDVMPPILGESSMDDYNPQGDWFNNKDHFDDSTETATRKGKSPKKPEHGKNTDFVHTGVGEVEKPSSRNRRNGHYPNNHHEVEKFKCDQCEKVFVLHAHLVEHLNRHKGNKNLVCVICEKEFAFKKRLKEHMRTHTGESPYLCPQCGKTFRNPSNLRQHIERHSDLKKYHCPECPSRFNSSLDLKKHVNTHTSTKSHECDICASRFTRSYSLQKHKRLHSGKRPFKCDQCNKTFPLPYNLKRHLRTHTGEKPYKCKYCERAYAESGDLNKHLRTHVGENIYMCDKCPMAFKYQLELRQHISVHYKMSQNQIESTEEQMERLTNTSNHKTSENTFDLVESYQPLTSLKDKKIFR